MEDVLTDYGWLVNVNGQTIEVASDREAEEMTDD